MIEYRNIVVATDFSENSDTAFVAAVELAKRYGAKLQIVHAFAYPAALVSQYGTTAEHLDSARSEAKRMLQVAAEKAEADGVEVERHFEVSPAAIAIVEVAADTKADLIVVGTRGNTGLKHVVLGSVAERTVRTAPCSVLTVKHA